MLSAFKVRFLRASTQRMADLRRRNALFAGDFD